MGEQGERERVRRHCGNQTGHNGGSLSFGGTLENLERKSKYIFVFLYQESIYLFIVNLFGDMLCVFLALIFRAFIVCSCSFFFCAALFAYIVGIKINQSWETNVDQLVYF